MTKSKLHSIKNTGFKTPDNYFNQVSDSILDKIKVKKDIDLPQKEGFKVPHDYFDKLESDILSKMDDQPSNSKVRHLSLRKGLYYLSGVAAALIIFFSVFPFGNSDNDITLDMVQSYFETKDLDSYELAELLIETDLLELEELTIETDYNDDELEAYLLENADLEQIIIQ